MLEIQEIPIEVISWKFQKFNPFAPEFPALPKLPKLAYNIDRQINAQITRSKYMDKLYSASEARTRLGGMSTSSFKRLVDAGKIRKVTPPNKVQGMYIKEDVDQLAEAMQEFIELHTLTPKADKFDFVQAQSIDDIKATVQIARQNLGDNAYGLEKRMTWFHNAPKGDYVLKHDGIIVGYFSMQAIKPETVENIFKHKSGRSIQLEDMEPILPNKPLEVHVSGIGVKKGISQSDASNYGIKLIEEIASTFIELAKQGIEIKKVWGKSSTVKGIRLCRDLGFTEIGYVNSEQIGFLLDLDTDKDKKPLIKRFIHRYQAALQQVKKQQELYGDNEPETSNREEKAYIKTYSKAERKPEKTGDTERQTNTNQKSPSLSGRRSTKVSSQ